MRGIVEIAGQEHGLIAHDQPMCAHIEQENVDFLFALGGLHFLFQLGQDLAKRDILGAFFQLAMQFPVFQPFLFERFLAHWHDARTGKRWVHQSSFG